MKVIPEAIRAN